MSKLDDTSCCYKTFVAEFYEDLEEIVFVWCSLILLFFSLKLLKISSLF